MQAKYLKTALQHAHLMPSWRAHVGTGLVGVACFLYEDIALMKNWPPIFHCLWHCLSAAAMGLTNGLLGHLEIVLAQGLVLEGLQTDLCQGAKAQADLSGAWDLGKALLHKADSCKQLLSW
jgi:hypothetical protein